MAKKIIRSDEKKSVFGLPVNGPVFFTSAILIIIAVVLTIYFGKRAETFFTTLKDGASHYGGWVFILAVNVFLIFMLYLAFSKFGKMRIGGAKAKPEFSTTSWFAMLFSAGMGIGLLFWSIAEPVFHFSAPPIGEGGTPAAAREAMNLTFLHWGFHAWGIYALVGLSLAYFTYSKGLPLTIRSAFFPLLGNRIYGRIGDVIDIFAVLATLFGLTTSLGLGVSQVAAGLNHLWGIENSTQTQIILIIAITAVAVISVTLGIDKGVRFLSEWNMRFALILFLSVFILGPTFFILKNYLQSTGNYANSLLSIGTWAESFTKGNWQNSWTIFYWGWWIAWSPFVGMFIARISKGRSIKEFILGVLIVPTLVTFLWMTTFGSTALMSIIEGNTGLLDAVNADYTTAIFVFLEQYPITSALSVLTIILIIGFFVTSSDSGSLVVDSLTTGGKIDSPIGLRIFWASAEGVVAAALLIGGGLGALQTASIVTGLPFAILLLIMCFSLYRGLKEDQEELKRQQKTKQEQTYKEAIKQILETSKK